MNKVEWDEPKRQWTLATRGVDFARFVRIFDNPAAIEIEDDRQDYGEQRWIVLCPVNGRLYHLTYTWRGDRRRIISVGKANRREQRNYEQRRRDRNGDRLA